MSTKAARGAKRTCQNTDCGSRFYDLGRDPIVCPMCSTEYRLTAAAAAMPAAEDKAARRPAKKSEAAAPVARTADIPEVEAEEALAAIEGEEPVAVEEDETFLEQEEDEGSDVSGIIGGGPGGEPEEEV